MFKRLLSVGSFTLLSRITGFIRDILMASILGKGALFDAFVVAFRFPNYFRAIFGEGTINPAFLPRYAAFRAKGEIEKAAERIVPIIARLRKFDHAAAAQNFSLAFSIAESCTTTTVRMRYGKVIRDSVVASSTCPGCAVKPGAVTITMYGIAESAAIKSTVWIAICQENTWSPKRAAASSSPLARNAA